MANLIPQATQDFNLFKDSTIELGVVNIELGTLPYKVVSITGAGIGGEVEAVLKGKKGPLDVTVTYRTVTEHSASLLSVEVHHVEAWASVQHEDSQTGELVDKHHKIIWRLTPKSRNYGTLEPAALQNRSVVFACRYIKEMVDGAVISEWDPFNYIDNDGGVDVLATVRRNIGL